jgi:hypothetical protein
VPTPAATSDARPTPESTRTTEETEEADFLEATWARVEKNLPEDPKKRRIIMVSAAVALLLLVLLVGKCASTPKRKVRTGPDPTTIGSLIVKSNRPNATIEAASVPPSPAAAPETATGTVDRPITGLPPGKYVVTARSDGWPDSTVEASIQAGGTAELTLDFASGSLRLDSVPTGANVRLGQTVLGRTPLAVPQLPPGECALTLDYPNWTPLKTKVVIVENTETKETVRIPHGRLIVTSAPTGATVLLGKRSLGQTPLTLERFQAGSRTLILQLKSFPPLEVPVTLEDQGEQNLRGVMANGFPLLDAPATLQAVWFELPAGDPNRLSPHFDPFPGFHPQGTFVRNLNRKKLFEVWLGRTYRFTGTVKSYNPATGQLEFVEQVSSLGKIRIAAQLLPAARDDRENSALLATKDATVTICGRFTAMDEFERRGRPFEIEFTQADVVP